MDLVAATQTLASHRAAMEAIKFDGPDITIPERYLMALSINTHPLEKSLEGSIQ